MRRDSFHIGPSLFLNAFNDIRIFAKSLILIFLITVLFTHTQEVHAQVSPNQYDYPHNHLDWFTIESDHFLVHYQEGNSRSAQVVSRIAEEIYLPITGLYSIEPRKKVSIILRDREDISNGIAYFFDDKIEIWVPALDSPLRGTHNWLRNVITHEFTHIIQLQKSMRRPRSIPAVYLQWLSYEDVRRPDILYGFPNSIASYPFASVSIPAWFAEGSAQYQRTGLGYDYWDSHRDMILRTSIFENSALELSQMNTFSSKSGFEREKVYNQGFSFTIYLVNRFGEQVLREISHSSSTGHSDFDKAIEVATGIPGTRLFEDWLNQQRIFYDQAVAGIIPSEHRLIEENGYLNFFPKISNNGKYIAYLSNRGRDYARTALYLKDLHIDSSLMTVIDPISGTDFFSDDQEYAINHGLSSNPKLDFISTQFTFSPDGNHIVYSRADRNRYGEVYRDLYVFDISKKEIKQLTHGLRIQDPAWQPGSDNIAAIQLDRGTQNLVLFDPENQEIIQLTDYQAGETLYTPVWNPGGTKLYYVKAGFGHRRIRVFDIENQFSEDLLVSFNTDYRDPFIDSNNRYIYFSANPDGIFNIYRMDLESHQMEKITNVHGGAFQPFAFENQILFSEYQGDGYKIVSKLLDSLPGANSGSYSPPYPDDYDPARFAISEEILSLNDFDDRDLSPLDHDSLSQIGNPVPFSIQTQNASNERTWSPYNETITGFSFYPVIRFDNYTQLRGRNNRLLRDGQFGDLGENLWRDMKLGFIFSSREVTERINLFGGLMAGFGSRTADSPRDFIRPGRLIDLDRDLFLVLEHRGLPFVKTSWSPTVVFEFYNMKRNVRDGLQVEEFPCTSCLPETTSTDVIYDIWEAGIYLRSKLNRWSLLELGGVYSPYRVSSDGFFSRELQQFIPGTSSEYFRGSIWSLKYIADLIEPSRHVDISPRGFQGQAAYRFQPSRLIDRYEINEGVLSPLYEKSLNHSFLLDLRYGFPTGNYSTLQLQARGFAYLNNPDNSFYLDYIGGFSGIQSYPYFAIGGEQTALAQVSWITPVIENLNVQVGHYTLDKLFIRFFGEVGNGWNSTLEIGDHLKTGIGSELRFALNSHYLYPMKLFISGAYGFNRFDVTFSENFITGSGNNRVTYGRELLFYFGLTFDFNTF
jgi:Tol biopolymer transport system component